ncbi:MAG: ABC transporter permease [Candidatus Brocadiae bacterium]|nr:ABC transporter permease [Candidatus Brocadiia bacterium]
MPEWRRSLLRLWSSRTARAGALLVLLYLGAAVFAGLAPREPREIDQTKRLKPPAAGHWLGTDELGRDVLSRVLHGSRLSLLIGLLSVGAALAVGVPLGLAAGECGGVVDLVLMRCVDVLLAFPGILLALAIMAVLGPSLTNLMLAVAAVNVPVYARQVRASVLQVRSLDYVLSARALGASRLRVVLRHILPNIAGPIIVLATLGIGTAILEAAGLGFVGLGVEKDAPEWGTMLASAREYVLSHPWVVLAPGVAASLAILGFNLLGDGLRDWLDTRAAAR